MKTSVKNRRRRFHRYQYLVLVLVCLAATLFLSSYMNNAKLHDVGNGQNTLAAGQTTDYAATEKSDSAANATDVQTTPLVKAATDLAKASPSPMPSVTTSSSPQPTLKPTPKPTAKPTPKPTAKPTPKPTAKPTPKPTPKPTTKSTRTTQPGANGIVWYNGFADPRTITPKTVSNAASLTVLVNKYWQLPKGYVPSLVSAQSSSGQKLQPAANDAWNVLYAACFKPTGIKLYIVSAYRSQSTQTSLFNRAIAEKGVAHTIAYYAYPGRSEHQLGLALDLGTTAAPYESAYFATTPAGRWLAANAHLYGFILRYPSGKQSITGYGYEAWHFRFLGVEAATAIKQKGVTVDEYYG